MELTGERPARETRVDEGAAKSYRQGRFTDQDLPQLRPPIHLA